MGTPMPVSCTTSSIKPAVSRNLIVMAPPSDVDFIALAIRLPIAGRDCEVIR